MALNQIINACLRSARRGGGITGLTARHFGNVGGSLNNMLAELLLPIAQFQTFANQLP